MSESSKRKPRIPECARCRNHGVISPVKGHKRFCPFANCLCTNCVIIVQKQKVSREQIALRRRQTQDEAAGLCLPVPETMLHGRGGSSIVATNLRALNQKFPNINLGRLHAVLKESGGLKQAVARLQREERTDSTWSVTTNSAPSNENSAATSSFSVRSAPPTSTKTEDFANEYASNHYYPPPPSYNTLHMYGTLSPYYKANMMQNAYCQNFDGGEFRNQQAPFLLPMQPSHSPSLFYGDISYASMPDSSRNLAEYGSIPSEDDVSGRNSPGQAASQSAFPNPSPNTISSDDEGPLLIDC